MSAIDMTGKEIITRVIERKDAPRIGFSFNSPYQDDFYFSSLGIFKNPNERYSKWGRYPEILAKVPGFKGDVRVDRIGNIIGRVGIDKNGECIKGILQDDWDLLETFDFPEFENAAIEDLKSANLKHNNKYVVFVPPVSVFSTFRDARLMENALADTLIEPENVQCFLTKVLDVLLKSVDLAYDLGGQALFLYDDWGMQHAPFISPTSFSEIFKPTYKVLADELHNRNMKLFVHSCGLVWDLIPHFIDAGIDVLQFDQPELSGSENIAKTFGKQVTLFSPVDIQKIMTTGDRNLIEGTARKMLEVFRKYADGALIACDYGDYAGISVEEEWATWAREIFLNEGWNR